MQLHSSWASQSLRITVLQDNTTADPRLDEAWGFAALIEHGEHALLLDAGGDPHILLNNVGLPGIDLRRIEAIAIPHAHGDHTNELALDIHPLMLSRWWKQVRDGVLRGKGRDLMARPLREIQRLPRCRRCRGS